MTVTRKLFGTDGIRGRANVPPMDAGTALRLGQAAGQYFNRGAHRHRVLIGKDTRLSGYMIESALTAGFISAGMDVLLVGPLPTPAIAMLTRNMRADLGVMVSASHNSFEDNGIKLFGPDGLKLSDEQEAAIEALMEAPNSSEALPLGALPLGALPSGALPSEALAAPAVLGRASRLDDAAGRYIEAVKATFPKGSSLSGLRIAVDCANGAAYKVAPTVLWELGAEVVTAGVSPDGVNINKGCGATSPDALTELVRERRADVGIALDGDADRLILSDERGRVVDGDQVLALIANSWERQRRLRTDTVVATVMSNMGLERYLGQHGLRLDRTQVGDRYVAARMRETGSNLGGEQSGHLIMSDYATTGDGLIAALQVLAVLAAGGKPASEACACFRALPQRLVNIRYTGASPVGDPEVKRAICAAQDRLGERGRVLIRTSGTEPLIRVMAEAEDEREVTETVDEIASVIRFRMRVSPSSSAEAARVALLTSVSNTLAAGRV